MTAETIPIAVVGATGYTGAELLRLLLGHPGVRIVRVCGQSKAGQPIAEVLPSFAGVLDGDVAPFDAVDVAGAARVAFCGLPHGASAGIVAELRARGVTVLDLSADFRLRDRAVYEATYGAHGAPDRMGEAVYGLVELYRDALRAADLVAVPGCYPTSAILPLAPLLREKLVDPASLIVDAKSGVSGAGRAPKPSTHLPEAAEGIRAYKVAGAHRHVPEIEQELSAAAGTDVRVSFTPHLVPMTRGILTTAYARAADGVTAARCTEAARKLYEGSPSVTVLDPGSLPDTLWARGSNRAFVSYHLDARVGRVVALCALDNLVKGASGQAVQSFNVRFGFDEGEALRSTAVWP